MGFGQLQAQSIDIIVYFTSPLTRRREKRGRVQQMALDALRSVARGPARVVTGAFSASAAERQV
jgi:C-terminal processing protease CtpA/Prc